MTTRNLKIDLTPGGVPQVIRVSQYDNGGIVDCEYNHDLTKAIERIEAALFN